MRVPSVIETLQMHPRVRAIPMFLKATTRDRTVHVASVRSPITERPPKDLDDTYAVTCIDHVRR